jgi:hypothetical protein
VASWVCRSGRATFTPYLERVFGITGPPRELPLKTPQAIEQALTLLLLAVHQGNLISMPNTYLIYSDAVTRAASDKGRRADREEILFRLIQVSEAGQN